MSECESLASYGILFLICNFWCEFTKRINEAVQSKPNKNHLKNKLGLDRKYIHILIHA